MWNLWKNVRPEVVLNSAPNEDLSPRAKEGQKHFLPPERRRLSTATKPQAATGSLPPDGTVGEPEE